MSSTDLVECIARGVGWDVEMEGDGAVLVRIVLHSVKANRV